MKTHHTNCGRAVLLLVAIAVTLTSVITSRADYPGEVLVDGPLAYYRLNENVTTPAFDVATNSGSLGVAGNGVYGAGVTHLAAGAIVSQPGNAAVSVAGSDKMRVPFQTDLNVAAPFSFEFWAKPADSGTVRCVASSIKLGNSGWLFYNSLTAGQWTFRTINASSANINVTGGIVTAGAWQHVAGVWDGSTTRLYVNGVQVASASAPTFLPVSDTTVPLTLGARSDNGFFFNGGIDEAAYYSNALSAGQILAHYQAGTNAAPATPYDQVVQADGPVAYWRLAEPAPVYPVATNLGSLGAVANGAYKAGVTNSTGPASPAFPGFGATNPSAAFDGSSGAIQIGNPAGLNITNQITVIAWVMPASTSGAEHNILAHGYSLSPNGEVVMRRKGGSYDFGSWDGADHMVHFGVPVEDIGNWVMLGGTYDGNTWRLYHNGDLVDTNADSTGAVSVNAGWAIGSRGGAVERLWDGGIDEVAAYNKALTGGRIMSLYFTAIGSNAVPYMVSDPPTISPSGTIYSTTTFSLTADVAGALPMSFQWRTNGTPIPGATSFTYTKTNATTNDSANYDIVVTNAFGAVTSLVATVTVNPATPPTITSQPASRSVYAGATASFSVSADGTTPFTYQWKHAATNLPGATNVTLVVTNCSTPQAGAYTVGITNVAGGVISSTATLTLLTPTVGSFEEAVVTNGPLAYWRLNESGTPTAFDYTGGHDGTVSGGITQGNPGPASPAYPGFASSNTDYSFDGTSGTVLIGNPAELNFTNQISVVAWIKPASTSGGEHNILMHGYTQSPNGECGLRRQGGSYQFLSWNGTDHLVGSPIPSEDLGNWVMLAGTYDGTTWRLYRNGELVAQTDNSIGAINVNAGWAIGSRGTGTERFWDGDIDEVALYGKALSADSIATMYATAAYGSTTPPFVTLNPPNVTAAVGTTVTTRGGVAGSPPISYQWKTNGVNVPGATSSTLTLSNVFFSDSGNYTLFATNAAGSTNTTAATVTVMPPPTFANLTNGLVLHLTFDGNFADTSGRTNDASAPGGSPGFVSGRLGQAVDVNTTPGNNYLVISDVNADLTFGASDSFTIACWLQYTVGFDDVPIIGNAFNSTYQPGIVFTERSGKVKWTAVSVGGGSSVIADPVPGSTPALNNGAWHHVTLSFNRATATAVTYVDGVRVDARSIVGLGSLATGGNFTIGQDPTGNYGSASFHLDDVGIWRRALNDYEAASIYAAAQVSGESFDVYGPVKLNIQAVGTNLYIPWQAGTLQESTNVTGPYTTVTGATAPYYVTPASSASRKFYRVVSP